MMSVCSTCGSDHPRVHQTSDLRAYVEQTLGNCPDPFHRFCPTCGSSEPQHHPLHGNCSDPFHSHALAEVEQGKEAWALELIRDSEERAEAAEREAASLKQERDELSDKLGEADEKGLWGALERVAELKDKVLGAREERDAALADVQQFRAEAASLRETLRELVEANEERPRTPRDETPEEASWVADDRLRILARRHEALAQARSALSTPEDP